ncbi:MAG: hypothetical protein WBB00_03795 [Mycobacterium sp.]
MNWIELTILGVAIFAGACLQASIGFGMGMLVAPVLAVAALMLPAVLAGAFVSLR